MGGVTAAAATTATSAAASAAEASRPVVYIVSDSATTRHRGRRCPARALRMARLGGLASLLSTSAPLDGESRGSDGQPGPDKDRGPIKASSLKRARDAEELESAEGRLMALPVKRQRLGQLSGLGLVGGDEHRQERVLAPQLRQPSSTVYLASSVTSAGMKRSAAVMARWLGSAPLPSSGPSGKRPAQAAASNNAVPQGQLLADTGSTLLGSDVPIDVTSDGDEVGDDDIIVCLDGPPGGRVSTPRGAVKPSEASVRGNPSTAGGISTSSPKTPKVSLNNHQHIVLEGQVPTPSQAAEAPARLVSLTESPFQCGTPLAPEAPTMAPGVPPLRQGYPAQNNALAAGVDHIDRIIQIMKVGGWPCPHCSPACTISRNLLVCRTHVVKPRLLPYYPLNCSGVAGHCSKCSRGREGASGRVHAPLHRNSDPGLAGGQRRGNARYERGAKGCVPLIPDASGFLLGVSNLNQPFS